MRKMIALLIACVLLGSLAGCNVGTQNESDTEQNNIRALPNNEELTLDSSKEEIETVETLYEDEYGNYKSSSFWEINGEKCETTYCFDENGSIEYIMYTWEKDEEDDSDKTGRLLLNYTRSDLRKSGWKDYSDLWLMPDKDDYRVSLEYPLNSEGDKSRLLILYKRTEAEYNAGVEHNIEYYEDKHIDSDIVKFNRISSEINKRLSEMIDNERYSTLVESWYTHASSLDNSCEIEIKLQNSADVRVGTISALRNEMCDIVIEFLSDISKITVNFDGIGNYTFIVGEGWDREVSSSDHE